MLYFVFTVDGDWEEYYNPDLSADQRQPPKQKFLAWLDKEIQLAAKMLGGRLLHFVHTSPRARDFFLQPEFIAQFKALEKGGGNVGIHCHEDEPRRAYYYDDAARMKSAVSSLAAELKGQGLSPLAFRGGYLAFSPKTIPILERNGIFLDFSCEPGRFLYHENILVADWRGAPDNYYRLDYVDHRRPGQSRVFEIPLEIYIDQDSLLAIWRKARRLKARPEKVVVAVLAHSYEFGSRLKKLKIKIALLILLKYGRFVDAREALSLIRGREDS